MILNLLEKMCETNIKDRYGSFEEISADITKDLLLSMNFSNYEQKTYQTMAEYLNEAIKKFTSKFSPVNDGNEVLTNLENILKCNILEEVVQNNSLIINVFVNNGYLYRTRTQVPVIVVEEFYKLFLNSDFQKRKIILENLKSRLSQIKNEIQPFGIDNDGLSF